MSEAVLEALGYLTNGALNYYQTTHVVMAKRKVIETYIKQLQQENQQLKEQNDKIKIAITENCDLRLEVLKYKEVIEEVREYIEETISYKSILNEDNWEFRVKTMLEILDKAKGE